MSTWSPAFSVPPITMLGFSESCIARLTPSICVMIGLALDAANMPAVICEPTVIGAVDA